MEKLKNLINNLDKVDLKIMKRGLLFCLCIAFFAVTILSIYLFVHNIFLFELGLSILKLSVYFAVDFIVCGVVVDSIKKQSEI